MQAADHIIFMRMVITYIGEMKQEYLILKMKQILVNML